MTFSGKYQTDRVGQAIAHKELESVVTEGTTLARTLEKKNPSIWQDNIP